jgi:hypothetical protein
MAVELQESSSNSYGLVRQIFDGRAATLVLFSFLIFKVLSVVHFDLTTGLAVITAAGPVSAFLGAIFLTLPYALMVGIVYILSVVVLYKHYERDQRILPIRLPIVLPRTICIVALIFFVILELLIGPWPLLAGGLPSLAAGMVAGRVAGRRMKRRVAHQLYSPEKIAEKVNAQYSQLRLVHYVLMVLVLLYLLSTQMWLPRESVRLAGRTTEIAYVLDAGGNWTSLLTDKERRIVRVPSDDVESRTICRTRKNTELSSWQLVQRAFRKRSSLGQPYCT